MKDNKLPRMVTPRGTVTFAHCNKPDTRFSADGEGVYKITILVPKGPEFDAWAEKFLATGAEVAKEVDVKLKRGHHVPWQDGDDKAEEDDDKFGHYAGHWAIVAKSRFQPAMVDTKRDPLPDDVFPYGGDVVKVNGAIKPYKNGANVGITYQLRSVQLIEKNSKGSGASAGVDEFDEEEGYEAPEGSNDGDAGTNDKEDF